jgi:hypothetical protein
VAQRVKNQIQSWGTIQNHLVYYTRWFYDGKGESPLGAPLPQAEG